MSFLMLLTSSHVLHSLVTVKGQLIEKAVVAFHRCHTQFLLVNKDVNSSEDLIF